MKTNFFKKAGAFAGLAMLLVTVNSFGQTRLTRDEGGFQRVETNCVCRSTGTIVGSANDCGPGMGACIDTDCSGTSC